MYQAVLSHQVSILEALKTASSFVAIVMFFSYFTGGIPAVLTGVLHGLLNRKTLSRAMQIGYLVGGAALIQWAFSPLLFFVRTSQPQSWLGAAVFPLSAAVVAGVLAFIFTGRERVEA
jgi:hypothetical protein